MAQNQSCPSGKGYGGPPQSEDERTARQQMCLEANGEVCPSGGENAGEVNGQGKRSGARDGTGKGAGKGKGQRSGPRNGSGTQQRKGKGNGI